MKFIVFACVIILALQSSSGTKEQIKNRIKSLISDEEGRQAAETCLSENNMTRDDWISEPDIMNNVHEEPENAEKKRNNGCTIACILKKLNLMDESGIKESKVHEEINKETSASPLEKALAHRLARKCMKEVRDVVDPCDKGFGLYVCFCRAAHDLQGHEDHDVDYNNSEQ